MSVNLNRGRVVVLVVGDGIRAETERLVSALQSHAGFHFTFALIELAVFHMPNPGVAIENAALEPSIAIADGATFLVLPRTLMRTTMIERGIVRVAENGAITIQAPPVAAAPASITPGAKLVPAVSAASITSEQFFDAMAARDPTLPNALRAFLGDLEHLGVYPDFQRSLNLKWEAPTGRLVNLSYIKRGGQVWSDAANWHAPKRLSHIYVTELAEAWGGVVDQETFGENWHVRVGGKAPRIETLVSYFEAWKSCIVRFIRALQAAGEDEGGIVGAAEWTSSLNLVEPNFEALAAFEEIVTSPLKSRWDTEPGDIKLILSPSPTDKPTKADYFARDKKNWQNLIDSLEDVALRTIMQTAFDQDDEDVLDNLLKELK